MAREFFGTVAHTILSPGTRAEAGFGNADTIVCVTFASENLVSPLCHGQSRSECSPSRRGARRLILPKPDRGRLHRNRAMTRRGKTDRTHAANVRELFRTRYR